MTGILKRLLAIVVYPILLMSLPLVAVAAIPLWILTGKGFESSLNWWALTLMDGFADWVDQ